MQNMESAMWRFHSPIFMQYDPSVQRSLSILRCGLWDKVLGVFSRLVAYTLASPASTFS